MEDVSNKKHIDTLSRTYKDCAVRIFRACVLPANKLLHYKFGILCRGRIFVLLFFCGSMQP